MTACFGKGRNVTFEDFVTAKLAENLPFFRQTGRNRCTRANFRNDPARA
jgi:hypothetical protein